MGYIVTDRKAGHPPLACLCRLGHDGRAVVLFRQGKARQGCGMTQPKSDPKRRLHPRREPLDLYDYCRVPEPRQKKRRAVTDDLSTRRVVDNWPDDIPVTPEEVDVIEQFLGDVLDDLFGPKTGSE